DRSQCARKISRQIIAHREQQQPDGNSPFPCPPRNAGPSARESSEFAPREPGHEIACHLSCQKSYFRLLFKKLTPEAGGSIHFLNRNRSAQVCTRNTSVS